MYPLIGVPVDQFSGVWFRYSGRHSKADFTDDLSPVLFSDPTVEDWEGFWLKVPNLNKNHSDWREPQNYDYDNHQPDANKIAASGADYLIIPSSFGTPFWQEDLANVSIPIIAIESTHSNSNDPACTELSLDECTRFHAEEYMKMLEDLAFFLTGEPLPPSVQQSKEDLCSSAKNFAKSAKAAQEKGVRALVSWISGEEGSGLAETNWSIDPQDDAQLKLFEVLGMPLLHFKHDGDFWYGITSEEYFMACQGQTISASCNYPVLFPADMHVINFRNIEHYDNHVAFREAWPDRAFMNDQWAPFTSGVWSYQVMAAGLDVTAKALENAERLYEPTDCIPVDVRSDDHNKLGLETAEYACYNQKSVDETLAIMCPNDVSASSSCASISIFLVAMSLWLAFE